MLVVYIFCGGFITLFCCVLSILFCNIFYYRLLLLLVSKLVFKTVENMEKSQNKRKNKYWKTKTNIEKTQSSTKTKNPV